MMTSKESPSAAVLEHIKLAIASLMSAAGNDKSGAGVAGALGAVMNGLEIPIDECEGHGSDERILWGDAHLPTQAASRLRAAADMLDSYETEMRGGEKTVTIHTATILVDGPDYTLRSIIASLAECDDINGKPVTREEREALITALGTISCEYCSHRGGSGRLCATCWARPEINVGGQYKRIGDE